MWGFYILLFVPILLQYVAVAGRGINQEKCNRLALAVFFIWLTLLVMLRHESVGNDTRNYIYYFEAFSRLSWKQVGAVTIEYGYAYWNKLVSLFSREPQVFLAVTAILINAMIYPTYRRLCVDTSLTVVLFCTMSTFVMMFSGIRQMIAIGLGVIAYEFTRNKKWIPFIIAVLVATSVHSSGFLLALIYPIYHAKITKKWLLAVVPVVALIFVFNEPIFTFLGLFIEQYTEYDAEIQKTGAYTMLILFAIFAVISFVFPDEKKMDEETIGLRNILLLSLVIQMFVPLHSLAMRMNYYFIIFIPLLIPRIIEASSKRWGQVAVFSRHVMVVFFLIYFFMMAYGDGALNVFPYHFFWETI